MTTRTERKRAFNRAHVQALLAAIVPAPDQRQLRERAAILARHGNSDQQIACELEVSTEIVRRWLSEAH